MCDIERFAKAFDRANRGREVAVNDVDTGLMRIAKLEKEVANLRILAERAYPGLKPSGLCSKHGQDNVYSCTVCFPDLLALLDAHNDLKQRAWARLKELGEPIPHGT